MSERYDRLRAAFKSTGLTQPQAVERFGFNRNTFKSNLNGNTLFGFEAAKEYGRAFNVRAEWLYDGTEPMRPERNIEPVSAAIAIPVVSWVAAGELRDMPSLDMLQPTATVTASDLPAGDWCATIVRGTSMDRLAPEGATIIFDVSDKVLLRGRPYLFSHRGEATFKLWEPDPVPHLVPHSTDPTHKPVFVGGDDNWYVIGRVRRSIYDFA
jgi:phage repressor protein C with HTH and peptisase S24 domain